MTWSVEELGTLAATADPSARIVSRQLLRNILQAHLGYPGWTWGLPHSSILLISDAKLRGLGVFAPEELPAQGGPDQTVLLIAQPSVAQSRSWDRNQALTWLWRKLYHGRIHAALHRARTAGVWDDAFALDWIDRLGWMEYREIRTVLIEENLIARDAPAGEVLEEFLAVVLELLVFDTERVGEWFPLLEPGSFRELLSMVGNPRDHLAACRPEGAIHPATLRASEKAVSFVAADREYDGREYDLRVRVAKQCEAEGNSFDAAVAYWDASVVEPTRSRGKMHKSAWKLLRDALGDSGPFDVAAPVPDWALHWLDEAVGQKAKPESEYLALQAVFNSKLLLKRVPSELCPWSFVVSFGKTPIRRGLPGVELLSARNALIKARLLVLRSEMNETVVGAIVSRIEKSVHQLEHQVREAFAPRFFEAMDEASFAPANMVEKAARNAIVEDMLDRLLQARQLSFGDLRDILARNEMKLPDLNGIPGWLNGDPLRRLDKAMARRIPGAYRPGEFYTTGLQALSSLFYATASGRVVLLWAILPLLMTIVLWKFPQYMHEELLKFSGFLGRDPGLYESVLESEARRLPIYENTTWTTPVLASVEDFIGPQGFEEKRLVLGSPPIMAITFVYFVCLLHFAAVRRLTNEGFSLLGRGLRWLFWVLPRQIIQSPVVRGVLELPPVRWLWTLGLKPALLTTLIFWFLSPRLAELHMGPFVRGICFIIMMAVFASRPFIRAEAWLWDVFGEWMHDFGIQSLYRLGTWLAWLGKQVLDWISLIILGITEWLRPKPETKGFALVLKGILAAVFMPVLAFLRFAVIVLLEPQINPIKHFPTVTIGHKFMLVLLVPLAGQLEQLGLEKAMAITSAFLFIFGVPGFFGFMVWELKENWRLYAANRPERLPRLRIGSHGESFLSLFRPGFHSGTIAKMFRRLRHSQGIKRLRIFSELTHQRETLARSLGRYGEALFRLATASSPDGGFSSQSRPVLRLHRLGLRGICVQASFDGRPPLEFAYEAIGHRCWLLRKESSGHNLPHLEALIAKNLAGLDAAFGVQVRSSDLPQLAPAAKWQTDGHTLMVEAGEVLEPRFLLDSPDQPLPQVEGKEPAPFVVDLDVIDAREQTPEWSSWVAYWDNAKAVG